MVQINKVSAEWPERGLKNKMAITPVYQPFVIPAGKAVHIPTEDYWFKALEGVLEVFHATFDHPLCGIQVQNGEPNGSYDSGTTFNIRNYMFGSQRRVHTDIAIMIPPDVPYGFYGIKREMPWKWFEWLRLSLTNIDRIDHYCLGYGYQIALATKDKGES